MKASFSRRFILTIRDIKSFLIEILCPIFLILIGLLISKIDMSRASEPTELNIAAIGKQIVLYGVIDNSIALNKYYFNNIKNITNKNINEQISGSNDKEKIKSFIEAFYNLAKEKEDSIDHKVDMTAKNYEGYFGGFLMLQDSGYHFKFIEVLNTRIKHIIPIFTENFFEKLIKENSLYKNQLSINYKYYPMPMTAKLKQSKGHNIYSLVILCVSIAFSLIPANFVTIIVKEKINNSKHFMRLSGMNIATYWIINFLFDLIKYYFTCGICILLL